MKPGDLVFIDESGSNAAMSPEYAWANKGDRAIDKRLFMHTPNVTIIGALTIEGLTAMMTLEGAADGPAFLTYVQNILVPTLRPGQTVVLDNVRIHKVAGVEEAIVAAGCDILYLPAYSPEFNPIEECWSKLKHLLRKARPNSFAAINNALAELLDEIRPSDARGWFLHAGYMLS